MVLASQAKRMDVVLAHVTPTFKTDAQLEGGLRGGHELLFIDGRNLGHLIGSIPVLR
jgi:hypothetical protein